ncbi:DNA-3-methyladenine glycosylase [Lactobacillus gigeriorum]|uniref:Putative 3-methyladenine DNA glycosylase n=1 Tax=Lactobacillus gigeriorum DSM 23908 = CRBIP 24.85 TaxID=1423751 RepID=I7LFK5_9LACO|nr:DNA-3-methyladenine glycosylase [Lactobacillus gigeriorum]KRN13780.1 hypothetical protein FC38_GL001834 [Lactobacillus gigeriorum DSM 23908 = CRBIP 24.85]CCI86748.1 Putative 3-methyladenine DNA glycosylase [Lactobacillus gigeriorum DSM 23908 = CRBIP 24.85]
MDYETYFSSAPTAEIAQDLLGRLLTFDTGKEILGGYIVETEAYLGKNDRCAHSFGGHRSSANEGLYGKAGTLYIYSQRQYFFFDVATQAENEPQGILIRAIEPSLGIEQMQLNRHGKTGPLLTNGPGKMMQALGITSRKWDCQFIGDSPFAIDLSQRKIPEKIIAAERVGVTQRDPYWAGQKLRFYPQGNPYVSTMKKKFFQKNLGWRLTSI